VKSKQKLIDQVYMRQAIELAKNAKGLTYPNPSVGALIVRSDKIIAEGFHKKAGGPHAEINALKKAGKLALGACMYVTLEPCSTFGKTPPCTQAIISAGIKRVVIGAFDFNPVNRKKSIKILRNHGIKVDTGILESEAQRVNEDFNKFMKYKKPFIILKVAQTLDGKMATYLGDSKWITSLASRKVVHEMRYRSQAVLTGIGTVLSDNPKLTCRLFSKKNNPIRIILDSELKISPEAEVLKNNCPKVIIFTHQTSKHSKYKQLSQRKHVSLIRVKKTKDGLSLSEILEKLSAMKIMNVLVETGPKLLSSFLRQGLADKVVIFSAPKLLADKRGLSIDTGIKKNISRSQQLKNVTYRIIDKDIMTEAYI
jgi:diaminohydroxyphosphoribosylaminopyrimidine deaminase/5-amino-6-(5-phosphoribosylamino)uracil reductase